MDVFSELLYCGFNYEKGRCSPSKWPFGYAKALLIHMSYLRKLCQSLMEDAITDYGMDLATEVYSTLDKRTKASRATRTRSTGRSLAS